MDLGRGCVQETPASSENSLSTQEQERLIRDTFNLLGRGKTEICLPKQTKKVVFVLGDTGNGKSKFNQWINGDNTKLIAREIKEGSYEYTIEDINAPNRCIITSETIYPTMVVDDGKEVAFCDAPGFNDTRDVSNEIATAYFIKEALDHADSVKMLFVINYPSVRKGVDRHNFMKLVKHVADFIKNIEKFHNSIALIVTKVDNMYAKHGKELIFVDNNKVIETVANFLIEINEELRLKLRDGLSTDRPLYEAAVKFISILLIRDGDQYVRIGLFRRPDEPGPVSEISLLQEEKKLIKRLIYEKLLFSEKEFEDFGYTISDKCKNKIHYFVEYINTCVWSDLCRVKNEIKIYFKKISNMLRSTVQSFIDENSLNVNLHQASELLACFRDGCRIIPCLVRDVKSVANPEDLAQKINVAISNLKIEISKNDLLDIVEKGKYFNFLQVVSDKKLSIRPWDEILREIDEYLSNEMQRLQEDIDAIAPVIFNQVQLNFQQIVKVLQNQMDEKIKLLNFKEAFKLSSNFLDIIVKIFEETETSVEELLLMLRDSMREMNINVPEQNALNVRRQEKYFMFLKDISDKELPFDPSAWKHEFRNLLTLNKSKIWYIFLDDLFSKLSEYKIQENRDMYNVENIEDLGKAGKPQGIVLTESNFDNFLRNIYRNDTVELDYIKNLTLTKVQLEELNQLLNLTLKHTPDIQYTQSSIFVGGVYISIKEILAYLGQKLVDGRNLITGLKSEKYKFLEIFALKKIFIDEDLSLPGLEVRIISPIWEIIGTRIINLNGSNGKAHSVSIAPNGNSPGSDGKHGKPGMPGKRGGNLFGIGELFSNGINLTITVNGGSGGPGQHGGDGKKGSDGKDVGRIVGMLLSGLDMKCKSGGFEWEHINALEPGILSLLASLFPFTVNDVYRIDGLPGQNGGDGGCGGKRGVGGFPGTVLIIELKKNSKIKISANNGCDGLDGEAGIGGDGGMNGMTTYAVFGGIIFKDVTHQVQKSAGTASSGESPSGLYTEGLEKPEPTKTISEPLKIINDYKTYAEKYLTSCFKKDFILQFIDLLTNNDNIQGLSFGI